MEKEDFTFNGYRDKEVFASRYSSKDPSGVLVVVHGMAEHRKRYDNFARRLADRGYLVYTYDQRGHGATAIENGDILGHVSPAEGWKSLIEDPKILLRAVKESEPDLPIFLFGHSMGSFVGRHLLTGACEELNGAIFSGTGKISRLVAMLVHPLAKIERLLRGEKQESRLMEKLLFSSNNEAFEPTSTTYDWLSRDAGAVRDYIEDELCGFSCSTGFYEVFVSGMRQLAGTDEPRELPRDLRVLFISGEADPVGGDEVREIAERFARSGHKNVDYKIYPEARHEPLNEVNSEEVIEDIMSWLS
ncbi:MAG: alpha/beta fold hydrolase [Candidatus Acetothermia bacterium]